MSEIRCPKCGSTQIHADKRGFKTGRAVAGTLVAGPLAGLAAGGAGQNKIVISCLSCGHEFTNSSSLKGGGPVDLQTGVVVGAIVLGIFIPILLWDYWWLMLVLPVLGIIIGLFIPSAKKDR